MAEYEPGDQGVNVFAFPKDKMQAVLDALTPLLQAEAVSDDVVTASAFGTGCNLTSPTPSSYDWVCDDQVAFAPE